MAYHFEICMQVGVHMHVTIVVKACELLLMYEPFITLSTCVRFYSCMNYFMCDLFFLVLGCVATTIPKFPKVISENSEMGQGKKYPGSSRIMVMPFWKVSGLSHFSQSPKVPCLHQLPGGSRYVSKVTLRNWGLNPFTIQNGIRFWPLWPGTLTLEMILNFLAFILKMAMLHFRSRLPRV